MLGILECGAKHLVCCQLAARCMLVVFPADMDPAVNRSGRDTLGGNRYRTTVPCWSPFASEQGSEATSRDEIWLTRQTQYQIHGISIAAPALRGKNLDIIRAVVQVAYTCDL
jgi:hypothetical protein